MKLLFNIIAVTGSAMFAGVLLAIEILMGGYWRSLPAPQFLDSFNNYLPLIPPAIGGVSLAAIIGLGGSILLSWGNLNARTFWLIAAVSLGILLLFTAFWFASTNGQFMAKSIPIDQVLKKLALWLNLHSIRIALATLTSVLGIIATSRQ